MRERWSNSAALAPCSCVPLRKDEALLGVITIYRAGGPAVHRQADRAVAELRGAGGHRDGERAAASPRRARRWSSRPRPPRCCRSSIPRPATSRRCSMRCWKRRCSLCEAAFGSLCDLRRRALPRGRAARRAARSSPSSAGRPADPSGPGTCTSALLDGERFVHIADIADRAVSTRRSAMPRPLSISAAHARFWRAAAQGRRAARRHHRLPAGSPAVLRQADRAVAELRGAGGHRDGERAAARTKSASVRPSCGSPSTTWPTASRCSTTTCGWPRGTAISSRLLDLPDALLAERPSLRRLSPLSSPSAANSAPTTSRPNSAAASKTLDQELRLERTRPDGRVIEVRRNAVPDGGFVLIYTRHHRAQARGGRNPGRARRRRSRAIAT